MENTQLSKNNKDIDILVKTTFDKLPELFNNQESIEFKKISFNKNSISIKF